MKRTAFISHSSKDKAVAEGVCNFLERNGISCWIAPRDVTPGKNYGVVIVDAIDECGVFVIILTGESNKSGQVVREVERAASANSVIIPLRVELVQPSRDLEFYVSSSHWLDASEKPLEKHLDSLVDAIRDWQAKSGMLTPAKVEPRSSVARCATKFQTANDYRHCGGRAGHHWARDFSGEATLSFGPNRDSIAGGCVSVSIGASANGPTPRSA